MGGHGIYNYVTGDVYEGEWLNDLKHGKGRIVYKNGSIETGTFAENKKHGDFQFTDAKGKNHEITYEKGVKKSVAKK